MTTPITYIPDAEFHNRIDRMLIAGDDERRDRELTEDLLAKGIWPASWSMDMLTDAEKEFLIKRILDERTGRRGHP